MANKISSFQWFKGKLTNGNWTSSNSLAMALLTKPHMYNTLSYIFGDKYYLQYLTAGSGRVNDSYTFVGNNEYTWGVKADVLSAVPIAESAGPDKGANFQYFTLLLTSDYFFEGCVLKTESGIHIRVFDRPTQVGGDFQYTFQVVSSDPATFVPEADLLEGKQLALVHTSYEEASTESGGFNNFPYYFKNRLTTARMSKGMSGSAATDIMILELGSENGKKSHYWMYSQDYDDMLAWNAMIERMRWYGKYNTTSTGEVFNKSLSGAAVIQGGGVLDQIATSNSMGYTKMSTDLLLDFITNSILASKTSENRQLMMFTGVGGIREFQKSILAAYPNAAIVDTNFVTKQGNKMKFDNQNFKTYTGILNNDITVVNVDMFNDRQFHTKIHPETGLPVESYRMVMLDFSDYGGEPNISLVAKGGADSNRRMKMWYEAGSTDPMYPGGDKEWRMGSSSVDGFKKHWLTEQGIKVTNPLACGQLYYAGV